MQVPSFLNQKNLHSLTHYYGVYSLLASLLPTLGLFFIFTICDDLLFAELIKKYIPNIAFVYSQRSAESFDEIIRKYSLAELMTHCKVMCISKKIEDFLKSKGWKKTEIFNPGEELIKIDQTKNG